MNYLNKADDQTRRKFVQNAAASLLGVSLMPQIFANEKTAAQALSKGTAKSVIYLYMSGGMSHLDSFDIKPENSEVKGKSGELKTNADGVRVSTTRQESADEALATYGADHAFDDHRKMLELDDVDELHDVLVA